MNIKYDLSSADLKELQSCIVCENKNLSRLSVAKTPFSAKDIYEEFLVTSLCDDCGHVFRSIVPSETWFLSQFDYRHKHQLEQNFVPINDAVEVERLDRYRQLSQSLAIATRNQSLEIGFDHVIDFGCGTGAGLKAWDELGIKARGIEPDESRANYGIGLGYDIKLSTWQNYREKLTATGMVTSIQSLEHFYEPKLFLKHVRGLVEKGTLLYVEVPDADSFAEDWNDALYLAHISNFTFLSLVNLLERCGFTVLDRISPYDSEKSNEENLCVLAVAGSADTEVDANTLMLDFNIDDWRMTLTDRYSLELPGEKNERCSVFHVPEINDLSLAYKRTHEVKSSVRANYKLREFIAGKTYIEVN